ncbi:MAG TPA: AAA family ATPase [Thermoleophilaceae bacterium]|nr:AAA family ATPase [Thermoleophilaceae bacterium]
MEAMTRQAAPQQAGAGAPSAVHELKTLVLSRHPGILIETSEPERAELALADTARDLQLLRFQWSVTTGLRRGPQGSAYDTTDPAKALAAIAELDVDALFELHDFTPHLSTPEVSRAFRELLERFTNPARLSTVVLVESADKLPPELDAHVVRYDLRFPSRAEYRLALHAVLESLELNGRAAVEITAADYDEFCGAVTGLTLNQARQAIARVAIEDRRLTRDDLSRLAEYKARALQEDGLLEYFPPADNRYELGGFSNLTRWLDRARVGFSPEAAELGLEPPKGILLVGVQGCGKSLAAKVIAREWRLPLLKLDAGRLFDKFIGETERNFRKAIAIAEATAPAILWIDELEKAIAPSGGGGDTDGGLSRRLFGSFLTWLQEKTAPVFVVATANDLSLLPPELLRKGRFDEIFFVDLPNDEEREQVFRIHLALRKQDPEAFDMSALVGESQGFSGAEIEQAVIASLLGALHQGVPLSTELVVEELRSTVPLSVSRREDVAELRARAEGRFVPVR